MIVDEESRWDRIERRWQEMLRTQRVVRLREVIEQVDREIVQFQAATLIESAKSDLELIQKLSVDLNALAVTSSPEAMERYELTSDMNIVANCHHYLTEIVTRRRAA